MEDRIRSAVIDLGLVTEEELTQIEAWPDVDGRSLTEKLYRSGLVEDTALVELFMSLGAQDGSDLIEADEIPPGALGALSRNIAEKYRLVPLQVDPSRVTIGMIDPTDTDALEAVSFFTQMVAEPRVVRASALFAVLEKAYGVPPVQPEPSRFRGSTRPSEAADGGTLPPPSANLPEVNVIPTTPVGDVRRSPLAAQLAMVAEGGSVPVHLDAPAAEAPSMGWIRDAGPSSPAVEKTAEHEMPTTSEQALVARDSLPPQVLPLLVPTFRTAMLFLVRDDVAVGWDGLSEGLKTEDIRDVLLPLTAPSAFARAWGWGMVAAGNPLDPTTTERIFFRFLKRPAPSSFVVLPLLVGKKPVILLYLDIDEGSIDDEKLASARQVGVTLADAVAPLVAQDQLFGP